MHCYICDKLLTDVELVWNKELGAWEPCAKCLEIALDAAYSGGMFVRPGDEASELDDTILDPDYDDEPTRGIAVGSFPAYDPDD